MKKQFLNTRKHSVSKPFLTIALATVMLTACSKNNSTQKSSERSSEKSETNTSAAEYSFTTLFPTSGNTTYHSYRIPSIIKTVSGVLIAACEARLNGNLDYGD